MKCFGKDFISKCASEGFLERKEKTELSFRRVGLEVLSFLGYPVVKQIYNKSKHNGFRCMTRSFNTSVLVPQLYFLPNLTNYSDIFPFFSFILFFRPLKCKIMTKQLCQFKDC